MKVVILRNAKFSAKNNKTEHNTLGRYVDKFHQTEQTPLDKSKLFRGKKW